MAQTRNDEWATTRDKDSLTIAEGENLQDILEMKREGARARGQGNSGT